MSIGLVAPLTGKTAGFGDAGEQLVLDSPTLSAEHLRQGIRSDALNDILRAGAVAASVGIGARGLLGLRYMFGRKKPNLSRAMGPSVVSVPAPVLVPQEKSALSRSEIPWFLPGVTFASIGGLAGGYKLMDVLMDRKRKADLRDEVNAARTEYQQALMDQYDPATLGPPGSVPDLPVPAKTQSAGLPVPKAPLKLAAFEADLDALYDRTQKAAEVDVPAAVEAPAAPSGDMPGWLGKGTGIAATIGGLLALGSGLAAYRFTKDRSTSKLVEEAIKQRERDRWARRPQEIYAIPTPVRVTRKDHVAPIGRIPTLPGTRS